MPRRVGNFADPLCDIVDEFLSHLNKNIMDGSGNVSDIVPELAKWAFQGGFTWLKKHYFYSVEVEET